jgi:competence protein ComEC
MLLPRGFPARWLGGLAFLPLFFGLPPGPAAGEMRVAVLDVGQGLAVVVRTEHHVLLFDTGPRFGPTADAGARVVAPYLVATGVRHLDGMLVSHDDIDHTGGTASVASLFPPGWLLSSLPAGHAFQRLAPTSSRCEAGMRWTWDGVAFEVLSPPPQRYVEEGVRDNALSCVVRVRAPGGSVLLTADIQHDTEDWLARTRVLPPTDVLVVPHHGSRSSSSPALLAATRPRLAVFSVGYRNRFGHPAVEVLSRYRQAGAAILRTDRDGAVELEFAPDGWRAATWRATERRYWRAGDDLDDGHVQRVGGEEE